MIANVNGSLDFPNITFALWIYYDFENPSPTNSTFKKQNDQIPDDIQVIFSNRLFGNGKKSDFWGYTLFI